MSDNLIMRTESAYSCPLLIKNLFLAPADDNPELEIVNHVKDFTDKRVPSNLVLLHNIRYVDEIGKTSMGKSNKKLLRETFLD